MPQIAVDILLAFTVLTVKHTVADFFFQTAYQYRNKGTYGHPGGLIHSAIHIVLTLPVYLVLAPATLAVVGLIAAGEFAVHYHTDWMKENFMKSGSYSVNDPVYWRAFGVDQLIHGLTYIAIVAILVAQHSAT